MSFGLTKVFSKRGGRIIEKWVFDAQSPLVSAASIATVNDAPRIVFGTKNGSVICVDENGKQLWTFLGGEKLGAVEAFFVDETRVHSIDAPPVITDVDRDGKLEVLVGTEQGVLYCLGMDGKLLWKYDTGGSIKASCVVEDINGDGRLEVLVGCTSNKLIALTGLGKKLFEIVTDAPVESVPGVMRGKKTLIIFGNSKGTLTAVTPAQEIAWKVNLDSKITAAPAFFTEGDEQRLVIGTLGGLMFCVNERGEIMWTYKTLGSIYAAAAIADLNNDDKPEIVFGSCDNTVYAITNAGQRLWSYETDFWITTTPLITDIDGDGKDEVIVGSYDHNIYILDSMGTYVLDYVPGLSGIVNQAGHYTNILTSDPGEQTGKKLYQYKTGGIVVGTSILTHNQKPTLVVNIKTGHVNSLMHEQ